MNSNQSTKRIPLRKVTLPNNIQVFEQFKKHVSMLYPQVQEYFSDAVNRIMSRKDIVVIDAGANIGLFAIEVYLRTDKRGRIYCFEPVKETSEVLRRNLGQFNDPEKLHTFEYGFSDMEKQVTFNNIRNATPMSSQYDPLFNDAIAKRITEIVINKDVPKEYSNAVMRFLQRLPNFMIRPAVKLMIKSLNASITKNIVKQQCEMIPLSKFIMQNSIRSIDLLKIDVEKAEMDVIRGMREEDWAIVGAVIMEIHNENGKLDEIKSILSRSGFKDIQVDQEYMFKGTDIYNLQAIR
jgi:FkbM family methyltransferase